MAGPSLGQLLLLTLQKDLVQKLSQASINVLRAEMAEQARIDRDQFVEQFQDSIKLGEAALFLTPINSDLDGRALADYCEAQARLREHCMTARIVIQPHASDGTF